MPSLSDTEAGAQHQLVALVGPTGSGKTEIALKIAAELGGEILNADSRQVYRHMDIGTAKPTPDQRRMVRHHLLDLVTPDEPFTLALFLKKARECIEEVWCRGKLPIIVGGTGQYVWGLLEGWQVPKVMPDPEFRRRAIAEAETAGAAALYKNLATLDPEAARPIDYRNVRRVIRALEVLRSNSGGSKPIPRRVTPSFEATVIGLSVSRAALHERLQARIERMIEIGWLNEVLGLLTRGYRPTLPSMSSIGYRDLALHIEGLQTLDQALYKIRSSTHKLVRQQTNWFRASDPRIRWFGSDDKTELRVLEHLVFRASGEIGF